MTGPAAGGADQPQPAQDRGPGEAWSGDARSGETRSGEMQPGETRPGETRPGDVRGGRRRRRQRDDVMVPEAQFDSYYGRAVIKPAPWDYRIPTYLYTGGLAAGSALIAAGAEMTGRTGMQRSSRLVALGALGASTAALVSDLGRPERFLNMLRVLKLTSPMSVGTWILSAFGAFTGLAAASEVAKLVIATDHRFSRALPVVDRTASIGAGFFAAPLAAYTAVLLSNTATPTWHGIYKELPFVFVGSGAAAAAGAALITTAPREAAPARRMALLGAGLELGAYDVMARNAGLVGEPLKQGMPGRLLRASKTLTVAGGALTLLGRRRRLPAVLAGVALNAASALLRFGVFHAGMESARDPKYTVLPQKERIAAQQSGAALAQRSPAPGRPSGS